MWLLFKQFEAFLNMVGYRQIHIVKLSISYLRCSYIASSPSMWYGYRGRELRADTILDAVANLDATGKLFLKNMFFKLCLLYIFYSGYCL